MVGFVTPDASEIASIDVRAYPCRDIRRKAACRTASSSAGDRGRPRRAGRAGVLGLNRAGVRLDNLFTYPYSKFSPDPFYQRGRTRTRAVRPQKGRATMKVIAYDRMKPGVTYEKVEP